MIQRPPDPTATPALDPVDKPQRICLHLTRRLIQRVDAIRLPGEPRAMAIRRLLDAALTSTAAADRGTP